MKEKIFRKLCKMRTWCAVTVGLLVLGRLAIYKISLGGWCNEFEMKTNEKWGARYTFAAHDKKGGVPPPFRTRSTVRE